MKRVWMIVGALALSSGAWAQGLKEWFSQKQTQTEYLVKQIAALQVYMGYLEKGYKIAQGGLNTIGDIKNGHFSLDKAFFDGLKTIHPRVRGYVRVADIIALNLQVIELSRKALHDARTSERFSDGELDYVDRVFSGLTDGCGELTEELAGLLSPGNLQLSDDERIKRIDGVYAQMQDRYGFVNSFCGDLARLRTGRGHQLGDGSTLQKIIGQ